MKSTARLVACALLTLALSGVGAVQAYADGLQGQSAVRGQHGHGKPHHGRLEQDGSSVVLRALGRLDRRLVHATSAHRLAPLTEADRNALLTNAEADEAAVGAVAMAYSSSPGPDTLQAAHGVLRTYRAVRYLNATNLLRRNEWLAADITHLQTQVTPGSDDATALDDASALLGSMSASGFSATTPREVMHAARQTVAQAEGLVGQVRDHLAL
jgi:hypothetical protein